MRWWRLAISSLRRKCSTFQALLAMEEEFMVQEQSYVMLMPRNFVF